MAYTSYLTNDYDTWTHDADMDHTSTTARCLSINGPGVTKYANIYKEFTLPREANIADLTIRGYRVEGDFDTPGYAYMHIVLTKPDSSEVDLYEASGDMSEQNFLDGLDITEHLQAAGTYRLTLYAETEVSWFYESGYFFDNSEVHYHDLLLRADTDYTTVITLTTETTTPTEVFDTYKFNLDLLESIGPIEGFQITKFAPPVAQSAIILVGVATSHIISEFRTGNPIGYFDTPEVDFQLPGIDKTLEEVQFFCQSLTPYTISVYVSIDGGLNWIYIGQDSVSFGKKGFVHPWLTAESFIVRFYGTGLYLFSYNLLARGGAPQIRIS